MSGKRVIRVEDVMKRKQFIEMDGLMTVQDALQALQEKDANVLIVAKRDDDDEFGLVLLSDITKQVLAQDRAPERVNIYEIMSKPMVSVHPRMDVRYCARLFDKFGLSLAPVIDEDKVIGIVGHTELVKQGLMEIHQ
ncbi:MAG: CBS domain-containing protein [Pseudomonadales bacterium]|nr:CBS domain-containing protein [Pseudomonadales bacterium]MDP7360594.1 CBS domain-containing protein [Pseudomonadales bacterium]MDP7594340.1 CBS domain-containing protein [Pseudomonadales bacterium]HJN52863.1 CBS domain-containing protein [Pseudomonadales bacterium]